MKYPEFVDAEVLGVRVVYKCQQCKGIGDIDVGVGSICRITCDLCKGKGFRKGIVSIEDFKRELAKTSTRIEVALMRLVLHSHGLLSYNTREEKQDDAAALIFHYEDKEISK